jgi:hypothetical protein
VSPSNVEIIATFNCLRDNIQISHQLTKFFIFYVLFHNYKYCLIPKLWLCARKASMQHTYWRTTVIKLPLLLLFLLSPLFHSNLVLWFISYSETCIGNDAIKISNHSKNQVSHQIFNNGCNSKIWYQTWDVEFKRRSLLLFLYLDVENMLFVKL